MKQPGAARERRSDLQLLSVCIRDASVAVVPPEPLRARDDRAEFDWRAALVKVAAISGMRQVQELVDPSLPLPGLKRQESRDVRDKPLADWLSGEKRLIAELALDVAEMEAQARRADLDEQSWSDWLGFLAAMRQELR